MRHITRYVLLALILCSLFILISTQSPAQTGAQPATSPAASNAPAAVDKPVVPPPLPSNDKSQPAPSRPCPACVPPDPWFIYTVLFVVLIGSFVSVALVRAGLSATSWSLADALSEEAQVTATETQGSDKKEKFDPAGKPVMVTELRASSSRLIALMGTIVILWVFLGFGIFTLYAYAKTGSVPESIDKVDDFLLAGLTLFAPYAVNKVGKMFESLTPKTPT